MQFYDSEVMSCAPPHCPLPRRFFFRYRRRHGPSCKPCSRSSTLLRMYRLFVFPTGRGGRNPSGMRAGIKIFLSGLLAPPAHGHCLLVESGLPRFAAFVLLRGALPTLVPAGVVRGVWVGSACLVPARLRILHGWRLQARRSTAAVLACRGGGGGGGGGSPARLPHHPRSVGPRCSLSMSPCGAGRACRRRGRLK